MAWQLIYTSALRTLVPGQSGYGTVARSADLREALIQRLEQLSYYQHIVARASSTSGSDGRDARPTAVQSYVVSAYRILDFRGSRYHVLTRIQDAGLDFTSRTNHLAHHLVFEPAELAGIPPPAIILGQWSGWCSRWEEGPRFLEEADWGDLRKLPRAVSLPANHWQQTTGDAGCAAALLARPHASGCYLLCQTGEEALLLILFAESLQLLDPEGRQSVKLWEHPFTTYLQAEDSPGDFLWRGCIDGTPGCQAIQRIADASLVPLRNIVAPASRLTKLAREGTTQVNVSARPKPAPPIVSPTSSTTSLRVASPQTVTRKAPESASPSPMRPAASPRAITLDFTSPRFWLPTLVIMLGLLCAFVWPGYLKSRLRTSGPEGASAAQSGTTGGDSGSLIHDVLPPAGSQPDRPQPKPDGQIQSPLPREALDDLNKQMDGITTWIIALDSETPFAFPHGAALDELLRKRLVDEKPLADLAKCEVIERRADFSGAPGAPVELESNLNETGTKQIVARFSGGARLALDCGDWFRALKDSGSSAPVKLKWLSSPAADVCTVLLRPATGSPMPAPLRLIVFSGKPPAAAAVRLSKSVLRANGDGLDALAPELRDKISAMQFGDARVQWQLRPSTAGDANADLLANLPAEFYPLPGRELRLDAVREQISERLNQERARLKRLEDDTEKLRARVQDERPVGRKLLLDCTNALASFADYVKAAEKKRQFNRQTYIEYLKTVLQEIDSSLPSLVPEANASDDAARLAFQRIHKTLDGESFKAKIKANQVPASYIQAWDHLAEATKLEARQAELKKAGAGAAQLQSYLNLVPPDLEHTPRVSLFLTRGGQRYEIIRFTDAAPKPAP